MGDPISSLDVLAGSLESGDDDSHLRSRLGLQWEFEHGNAEVEDRDGAMRWEDNVFVAPVCGGCV